MNFYGLSALMIAINLFQTGLCYQNEGRLYKLPVVPFDLSKREVDTKRTICFHPWKKMMEYLGKRKDTEISNGIRACTKSRYYLLNDIASVQKTNNKTVYCLKDGKYGNVTKKSSVLGKWNRAYSSILGDAEDMIRYASKMRLKWFGRSTSPLTQKSTEIITKHHRCNTATPITSNRIIQDQKTTIGMTTSNPEKLTEETGKNYDGEYSAPNEEENEDYDAGQGGERENVPGKTSETDKTLLSVSDKHLPFLQSVVPNAGSTRIPSKKMALFQAIAKKLETAGTTNEIATYDGKREIFSISSIRPFRSGKNFLSLQEFNEIFTQSMQRMTYDEPQISDGVEEESPTPAGTAYSEKYLLTNGSSRNDRSCVPLGLSSAPDPGSYRSEQKKTYNEASTALITNRDYGEISICNISNDETLPVEAKSANKYITDGDKKRTRWLNESPLVVWARNKLHLNKGNNINATEITRKQVAKKINFDLIPLIIAVPNGLENPPLINTTDRYSKTNDSQKTSTVEGSIFVPDTNNNKKEKSEKNNSIPNKLISSIKTENKRKSNVKNALVTYRKLTERSPKFSSVGTLPPYITGTKLFQSSFQRCENHYSKRSPNEGNHINDSDLKIFVINSYYTTYSYHIQNRTVVTNGPIMLIPEYRVSESGLLESTVKNISTIFQKMTKKKGKEQNMKTKTSRNHSYEGKCFVDRTRKFLCPVKEKDVWNPEPLSPTKRTDCRTNTINNDSIKRQLLVTDSKPELAPEEFLYDIGLVQVPKKTQFQRRKHLKALKRRGNFSSRPTNPTSTSCSSKSTANSKIVVLEEEVAEEDVTLLPSKPRCTCGRKSTAGKKHPELNEFTCDDSGEYTLKVTRHLIDVTDACEDLCDFTSCPVSRTSSETYFFNEEDLNESGETGSVGDTTGTPTILVEEEDEGTDQRFIESTLATRLPSIPSKRKCKCVCSCEPLHGNKVRNRFKFGLKNALFDHTATPHLKKTTKAETRKECSSSPTRNSSRKKGISSVTGTADYLTSTFNRTSSLDKVRSTGHHNLTDTMDYTETAKTEGTETLVSDYMDSETNPDVDSETYRSTARGAPHSGEVKTVCVTPDSGLILKIRNCTCNQEGLRNRALKSSSQKKILKKSHPISKFVTSGKIKKMNLTRNKSRDRMNRIKSFLRSGLKNINLKGTSSERIVIKRTEKPLAASFVSSSWLNGGMYDEIDYINIENINSSEGRHAYTTLRSNHYLYPEEKKMVPTEVRNSNRNGVRADIPKRGLFEIQPIELNLNRATWRLGEDKPATATPLMRINNNCNLRSNVYQNATIDLAKSENLPKVLKGGNAVASVRVIIGKKRKTESPKKKKNTQSKNHVKIDFLNFK